MKTLRILTPFVAFGALALAAAEAQAQNAVGVNAAVRNSVQQRSGSAAARPAQVRGQVRLGDQFTTGANSQVQVLLNDRSTFTVGPNARMTVDRFVVSEGGSASVARGAFRFASGRTTRGSSRQAVSTPVASIGVRGTIIEGVVGPEARALLAGVRGVPPFSGDDDTMLFLVLRGPAGDADTFDTPGGVDVEHDGLVRSLGRPGQALIVTSDGVFGPFYVPDDVSAALAGLITPPAGTGADPGAGQTEMSAALFADDVVFFGEPLPPPGGGVEVEPIDDPDKRDIGQGPTQPNPAPGL